MEQQGRGPSQAGAGEAKPVFGFILLGGVLNGATVRDVRLANELADRGYDVHVWWAMDRLQTSGLRPQIHQRWLFHGLRYVNRRFRGVMDAVGRAAAVRYSDLRRAHVIQKRPRLLKAMWHAQMRFVCGGVEQDRSVLRRFAEDLTSSGVTHLLPSLELFAPWAMAAQQLVPPRLRYLVTFQGYETYGNFAREMGLEQEFYQRIVQAVEGSDWPAIAVSPDYAERIVEDVGIRPEALVAIPPGVPEQAPMERAKAQALVSRSFPDYLPDVPLITFVGRQDSEKGVDLLLYAANILRRQGTRFQLHICGPSAFGSDYRRACLQIAESLRSEVRWKEQVSDELRTALFVASRCVVYPSIHREPFGMVPVEAMAQGTPAIVPDWGGVAGTIQAGDDVGGLRFSAWDSGHLALQIARLLSDDALRQRLSESGRRVAQFYSVPKLADRVLAHLGIEPTAHAACRGDRVAAA